MTEEANKQPEEEKQEIVKKKIDWSKLYNKNYKIILFIPVALFVFSVIFLFQFNATNGDIILKDVSLTGGTTITVFDTTITPEEVKEALRPQFPDLLSRGISDIRTGQQQAFFIETVSEVSVIKQALEDFLGYKLTTENSSTEFTGSTISSGFYQQLRISILIAFIFMASVVFLVFKTPIPSLAVIISALADIVFTIVVIDLFGISLSTGGIVAILMLIGYSVDTDILLTTRVLRKKQGSLNERMLGAFKTGITMTLTSILAIAVALVIIYNFSETLRQIFSILLIGLSFDLLNTWLTNASILKWYAEAKNIR